MTEGAAVLIDSDFWIGLFFPADPHAQQAETLFKSLHKHSMSLTVTNAVIGETATVLSNKLGQEAARSFLHQMQDNMNVIHVSEEIDSQAIELFMEQDQRGTSYVDCANVAALRAYSIPYICAFDKVYHKDFGLKNLAYLKGENEN